MDAQRFETLANDRIEAIQSLVERYKAAKRQTHTPSRRPSKLGVRVSGNADPDITYSDPTGQTSAILLDTLDRIGDEMRHRREDDYALARMLEDFAPARQWNNGIRRCTEEGCARAHKALGLCERHYRQMRRMEEREAG